MSNDLLKNLALKAKNRLIHKSEQSTGFSDSRIKIIQTKDEDFYAKVKALLERDIDVANPIKELMDETLMLKMDGAARERYLFQTIERYQKIRNRIECENTLKVVY